MRQEILNSFRRKFAGLVLFAVSASFGSGASAGLMNADFSAGFTGWSGELCTFNATTLADSCYDDATMMPIPPLPVDPSSYSDNYILPGAGSAKISTSSAGDVDTYFVSLFQDFTVDAIAPGSTLDLSLSVLTMLTTPSNGAVQLIDNGGVLPTIDLTAGGIYDITSWVGASAQLALFVSDDDFTLPALTDMITVSDITFTETASVPEPGSLLLFGLGMAGLLRRRLLA